MILLTALVIILCGGLSLALQRSMFAFAPLPYFVICSMIFGLSTAYAVNVNEPTDIKHLWLIDLYFLSILIYSVVFLDHNKTPSVLRAWRSTPWMRASDEPAGKGMVLLIISAAVAVFYYEALVGYNLFIEMLRGSNIDYTAKRLESYAGTGYAGVVNQFKNTILPITYFSLALIIFRRGHKQLAVIFAAVVAPFFLWAILGTGQRTFFFFSLAGLMLYLNLSGRLRPRHVLLIAAIFLPIFAMQSVVLGRSQSVGLGDAFVQLGSRLFGSNQMATVVGFRYVSNLPVQFGAEWAKILLGFIPGFEGSDLSHQIHYVIFQSMRGTAPVSLWVSIYHNFGMAGVIPVMIILMKGIEKLGYLVLRIPKSEIGICAWGFFVFYVSILPSQNIFQIINNGLPGLLLITLLFWSNLRQYFRQFLRTHARGDRYADAHSVEKPFR